LLLGAIVMFGLIGASAARAAVVFAPPDDVPEVAAEIKGIERELGDANYAAAARRLDALLAGRGSGDQLVNLAEGTLTSARAWVEQLPPARRQPLASEYERSFGRAAQAAVEGLRAGRATRPEELYAIARRYPMTRAAGAALVDAADAALRLGDLPAAQAFYQLAARAGATLDGTRARGLEEIRKIASGVPAPAPADLEGIAKPQASGRIPLAGPLPFDAAWFGNASLSGLIRFFPAAYDGRVVLASWNGVTMLRENGQIDWTTANRALDTYSTGRGRGAGRGILFAPAVLADVHGRPLVVVVRQPVSGSGEQRYALRALNADDGQALWTSETTDGRRDVSYAGLPAVSGRYVYGLAVARTGASTANLVLAAVDVMTGGAIWQTTLGSLAEQSEARGGRKNIRTDPLAIDAFAELSEPAVADDLVIVSPNCGSVIAVDRFNGRIRWVGVYRESEGANARQLRVRPVRWATQRDAEAALLLRYKSTPVVCNDVVIAMPQDVPALFAFDRAGGRRLWDSDLQPTEAFGLAGASGNMAILCGTALTGLDAGGTGKRKWHYVPPRGDRFTGPAVVLGETVIAPTSEGIVQLNVTDGTEKAVYSVPSFRRLLNTEGGKGVVNEAGAARSFGAR
jgi:outer membrane protein assembly factor BamB